MSALTSNFPLISPSRRQRRRCWSDRTYPWLGAHQLRTCRYF